MGANYKRCFYPDDVECEYGADDHDVVCEGTRVLNSYQTPIIRINECTINLFSIQCPLPQMDSRIRYGLRMSLPDMIYDTLSGNGFTSNQLQRGKYLFEFVSMASRNGGVGGP